MRAVKEIGIALGLTFLIVTAVIVMLILLPFILLICLFGLIYLIVLIVNAEPPNTLDSPS
jgi:hypothetical protein